MTEQNKNELLGNIEELERKYREDFFKVFKKEHGFLSWSKNPYWCENTKSFLNDDIDREYRIYISARKAAQVELDNFTKGANQAGQYLRDELKDRDQEIDRLKNRVKELGFNNDYVEEVEDKNWSVGEQLKERDELIKYLCSGLEKILDTQGVQIKYSIYSDIYVKAQKLIGGEV